MVNGQPDRRCALAINHQPSTIIWRIARYESSITVPTLFHFAFSTALRHSPAMSKSALGRGLGALLSGVPAALKPAPTLDPFQSVPAPTPVPDTRERVERVALGRIHPSVLQPRKDFPAAALQELADSIKEQGIIQPLIVRAKVMTRC